MWHDGIEHEIWQLFAEHGGAQWDEQRIAWQQQGREAVVASARSMGRRPKAWPKPMCDAGHVREPGKRQCKLCHRAQALESYHRRKSGRRWLVSPS